MSEEKSDEGINFDLDDILDEEVVEEIQIEDIEMEDEFTDADDNAEEQGSGVSFQDQVREYMMGLEDETFEQPPNQVEEEAEAIREPEVPEAPAEVIAASEPSSATITEVENRIMSASRDLDSLVQGVVQQDSNSLAATEIDIMEAKKYLTMHKLKRAKLSVKKAEKALFTLEEDVLYLRRSIAMLHRLLKEKKIDRIEAENILLGLRKATSAAEIGDVGQAATEIEFLVDDLIGGNTSTLNPFFFRHFWLGVDTRWPAGGDTGVLLVLSLIHI